MKGIAVADLDFGMVGSIDRKYWVCSTESNPNDTLLIFPEQILDKDLYKFTNLYPK